MDTVGSIANSGLMVAQRRLQTSANNVANVETEAYEAQREVAVERVSAGQGAGVDSCTSPTCAPHPVYQVDGREVLGSNTDLISETTERLGSAHALRANLRTLQTNDELTRTLLDIKA